jgi:cysteinyl-tRNA synthetase
VGGNGKHILRWSFATGELAYTEGEDTEAGFPGWHIECSAMASSLLGQQIDLHTGGEDNIFPHHECEIAQSECAFDKTFVKMWLHRRRIQLGEEKMSKSLGNVLDVPSIMDKGYSPLDLRYFLLSVHYRTNLKFEWKGLDDAKIARRTISDWIARNGVGEMAATQVDAPAVSPGHIQSFEEAFDDFMNADLNVSGAIATIFACMHKMNAVGVPSESTQEALTKFLAKIQHTFGCFEQEETVISADLEAIISLRQKARDEKDFAEADRLRLEIESRGFIVKDTKEGQKISKK